jgi:Fe-S cluster assembly ATP-binding protein
MLKITDLKVNVEDKEILKGVDLEVGDGETHALMGQNGSGKSTLAQVLTGHSNFKVTGGSVVFNGKDLLVMKPFARSLAGLFLSFQYPLEVAGVTLSSYLRLIYNKKHGTTVSPVKFRELAKEYLAILHIKPEILTRSLNEGFSGGEKKKLEMLQMMVLEPKLAILDEVDSGLDVDALKVVAGAVNYLKEKNGMSVLLITHYARILKFIKPDKVHVMRNGVIIRSGGPELAGEIEEHGYSQK